jgi:hypothetical protein
MSDKQLMGWAAQEIRGLRRANELMAAKCEVLDIFHAALYGAPQPRPMVQDFLGELDKAAASDPTS